MMRTTLALDDDVFIFAKETAQKERISMGKAVSKLVRQSLQNTSQPPTPRLKSKYSVFPMRDEIITSEHIYRLMEQEGI